MKISCEHCHKEISSAVFRKFNQTEIGSILCPHCHKKNRRYLSELDLLLYFSISSVFYSIGLLWAVLLMNRYGTTLKVIAAVLILVVLMYFCMRLASLAIYHHGWLKKDWKNIEQSEDGTKIARRLKREFWIFMLAAFVFATQRVLLPFYPAFLLVFLILLLIQIILVWGKEKPEK